MPRPTLAPGAFPGSVRCSYYPRVQRPFFELGELAAARFFVAARPFTGPGALMRRFGIGLHRARWLLVVLEEQRVIRGQWGRLVAAGCEGGRLIEVFGMYRVSSNAWRGVMACGPYASRRGFVMGNAADGGNLPSTELPKESIT